MPDPQSGNPESENAALRGQCAQLEVQLAEANRRVAELLEGRSLAGNAASFQALIAALPEGVMVVDANGRIEYASPGSCVLFALESAAGLIGRDLWQLVAPEAQPLMRRRFQQLVQFQSAEMPREYMLLRSTGDRFWGEMASAPILGPAGETQSVVIVARDISERKHAEEELIDTRAMLLAAFEQAPIPMCMVPVAGNGSIIVNPACLEFLGVDALRIDPKLPGLHRSWIDLDVDGKVMEEADSPLVQALHGMTTRNREMSVLRADGVRRWELANASPVYNPSGELIAAFLAFPEITDRKRMEDALRINEERLQLALESAGEGLWDWDLTTNKVVVSPSWYEILGYTPDEFPVDFPTYMELMHPDDRQTMQHGLAAYQAGTTDSYTSEARMRAKDGSWRWVLSRSKVVTRSIDGGPLRIIGSNLDIHARRSAELALTELNAALEQRVQERTAQLESAIVQLEKAAHMKDEFLATMSHELRTPLTAVLGMSEVLLEQQIYGSLNERQLHAVAVIDHSGRHLLELINDILDLTRIDAGKLDSEQSRFYVADLCRSSVAAVREQVKRKGQEIALSLEPPDLIMVGDHRRIEQILVNLLTNASKFTPEHGRIGIDVHGRPTDKIVEFTVWDNGIGIAADDLNLIFQPFVQLDSSLARRQGGTGLGLSLVQRLAELYGGSVHVESMPGQGSRFTVRLPWQIVPEPVQAATTPAAVTVPTKEETTLLVVDDDETNRMILADYLSLKGYQILTAAGGEEALRLIVAKAPDLVLMDIHMPGMDGLEAIRRLRSHPDARIAATRTLALTALAMSGDRDRCLAAGANGYLAKPYTLSELLSQIDVMVKGTA